MASPRKILTATRKLRPSISPVKRNAANNRLQKLRKTLNEDSPSSQTSAIGAIQRKSPSRARSRQQLNKEASSSHTCSTFSTTNKDNVNRRKRRKSENSELDYSHKVGRRQSDQSDDETSTHTSPLVAKGSSSRVNSEIMEWSTIDNTNSTTANKFYIVADTNIFISNLDLIKQVVNLKISDGELEPIIYIPWMVVEELDYIKTQNNQRNYLRCKAQAAIKFIQENLRKTDRVKGQNLDEFNQQSLTNNCQDNKIIACCLQVLQTYSSMILLTNDINMKNKAHLNHVPVCSHDEIESLLSKTSKETSSASTFDVISTKMINMCSQVITICSSNAYGEKVASRMPAFRKKPETLQACMEIFIKYWFTVFEDLLMKQFRKAVDDLIQFLVTHKKQANVENELNQFVHLCKKICIYLKDISETKTLVDNTLNELNRISC